jgi:mannosyltransferase
MALWAIGTPSYWRDEAVTLAAVQRPFGDLITMLGHTDAVHGAYYMLMWPLVHLAGSGEFVVRLPSAIAVAVAAGAVAAIGRRLISPWAGLAAGLLFAVLPAVSRYAQEARSYAIVTALATVASYLLLRTLQAAPGERRRWIVGYGVSLAAMGTLNIFSFLIIPAHAVTVVLDYRRHGGDRGSRRLVGGWLAAAVVSAVVGSPALAFGWKERHQFGWLAVNKSTTGPGTLLTLTGALLVTVAIVGVIGVALIVSWAAGLPRFRAEWPAQLAELALPWMILPPALLLTASLFSPSYTSRYILFCLPALALLGGAALAALRRFAGPVGLIVILIAGWSIQLRERGPAGHFDDIRAVDQIVTANARPGDVWVYTNPNAESFPAAYSYGLAKLRDIGITEGPDPSGTLSGTSTPLPVIRERLASVSRVWVVEFNSYQAVPVMQDMNDKQIGPLMTGLPFHVAKVWRARGDWVLLYARN